MTATFIANYNGPQSTTGAFNRVQQKNLRELGKSMEDKVCHYLQIQGLKLLKQNFLCSMGEIDLIMQDKDDLVFIEVRYRQADDYGDGIESITAYKQKRIINAANFYLNKHRISERAGCRFDVLAVSPLQNQLKIDWIRDAFQVDY